MGSGLQFHAGKCLPDRTRDSFFSIHRDRPALVIRDREEQRSALARVDRALHRLLAQCFQFKWMLVEALIERTQPGFVKAVRARVHASGTVIALQQNQCACLHISGFHQIPAFQRINAAVLPADIQFNRINLTVCDTYIILPIFRCCKGKTIPLLFPVRENQALRYAQHIR